jgi:hypothetical protein
MVVPIRLANSTFDFELVVAGSATATLLMRDSGDAKSILNRRIMKIHVVWLKKMQFIRALILPPAGMGCQFLIGFLQKI